MCTSNIMLSILSPLYTKHYIRGPLDKFQNMNLREEGGGGSADKSGWMFSNCSFCTGRLQPARNIPKHATIEHIHHVREFVHRCFHYTRWNCCGNPRASWYRSLALSRSRLRRTRLNIKDVHTRPSHSAATYRETRKVLRLHFFFYIF